MANKKDVVKALSGEKDLKRADLSGADLTGADLKGAQLYDEDLEGINKTLGSELGLHSTIKNEKKEFKRDLDKAKTFTDKDQVILDFLVWSRGGPMAAHGFPNAMEFATKEIRREVRSYAKDLKETSDKKLVKEQLKRLDKKLSRAKDLNAINEVIKDCKEVQKDYLNYEQISLNLAKKYREDIFYTILQKAQSKARMLEEEKRLHVIQDLTRRISRAKKDRELEALAEEVGFLQVQPEYVKEYDNVLKDMEESIEEKYSILGKGVRYLKKLFSKGRRASQIRTASKMLDEINQEIKEIKKRADLVPPLGKPGGIEHTRERIIKNVDNPNLEIRLIKKLEQGQSIPNNEAREVYTYVDCNKSGLNKIKQFCISSHAQYRMDQRGVSVHKLKSFFFNLEKYYERNEYNLRAKDLISAIDYGMQAEWTDPMTKNLTVAFEFDKDAGTAKIITAYFKNKKDPVKI